MKRILLASTAIVAFAGAASADVTWSGDAFLEYNDNEEIDDADGNPVDEDDLEWGLDLNVTLSEVLDNGLTASASLEFDVVDETLGDEDSGLSDFVLSLTSETAGLFFGDTGMAADSKWSAAGDMETDDFSETDGEIVLRGEVGFGPAEVAISYIADEQADDGDYEFEQLSLGVEAEISGFTVIFAYQEEGPETLNGEQGGDYDPDEVYGLNVSTTFAGADVAFAYSTNETEDEDSIGVEVAYPLNDAITLGGYYVIESDDDGDNYAVSLDYVSGPLSAAIAYEVEQDEEGFEINVDYEVLDGLLLFAGYAGEQDDDGFYVGGSYDLGAGAEVRLIYVEADNFDEDNEYFGDDDELGTTLELSFSF